MKRYFFLTLTLLLAGCIYPLQAPDATDEPDIAATLTAGVQPENYQTLLSSDGNWQADVIIYNCAVIDDAEIAYEKLEISHVESGEATIVSSQLQFCGGLGAFGLLGLYWSPNSRFFYYTDAREGSPDGGCGFWARPIIRLDVTDMSSTPLGAGYISRDGTKLATWHENVLVISDLDAGELARLPIYDPNAQVISMFWLPDMSGVIYLLADTACGSATKSMLIHVDASTFEQTLVFESGAE